MSISRHDLTLHLFIDRLASTAAFTMASRARTTPLRELSSSPDQTRSRIQPMLDNHAPIYPSTELRKLFHEKLTHVKSSQLFSLNLTVI